jgi:DNA-nicking Smr family endonuclease
VRPDTIRAPPLRNPEAAIMTEDDRDAFRKAMRDVRPLARDGRVESVVRPAARARMSRAARAALIEASRGGAIPDSAVNESWGEEIAFRRPSVPERVFRNLRAGRFSIEAELDLHGMTAMQAELAMKSFITECAARELGCVRLIHGKGARSGPDGPVLKNLVQLCLPRWDSVLAFVTAQPRDGGHGASYVLLTRRQRRGAAGRGGAI